MLSVAMVEAPENIFDLLPPDVVHEIGTYLTHNKDKKSFFMTSRSLYQRSPVHRVVRFRRLIARIEQEYALSPFYQEMATHLRMLDQDMIHFVNGGASRPIYQQLKKVIDDCNECLQDVLRPRREHLPGEDGQPKTPERNLVSFQHSIRELKSRQLDTLNSSSDKVIKRLGVVLGVLFALSFVAPLIALPIGIPVAVSLTLLAVSITSGISAFGMIKLDRRDRSLDGCFARLFLPKRPTQKMQVVANDFSRSLELQRVR